MNKTAAIFLILGCSFSQLKAQSYVNSDSIFQQSLKELKDVFLVFSGSDWCTGCIRFEKNILQDTIFKNFISSNFLYLNADFPQRKKLPEKVVTQNEMLAEKYNSKAAFPTLLLIAPDKRTVYLSYHQESTQQFIDKLKKAMLSLKQND
jgi:thiamine biosynthesis lipoprotein